MSQNRDQFVEQMEGLDNSLTAVLDRLGQIELEITAAKNESSRQIKAIRDFLNSPQVAAMAAGPSASAGAEVSRANEAIQKLSVGETQEQILEIFLEEVEAFTNRAILFLQQGDSFVPWKSLGFSASILESARVQPDDPIDRSARQQRIIYRTDKLEEAFPWLPEAGDTPVSSVCIPLVFEDTSPVVLYADSGREIELDSLELLSHLVVLVLKNHYLMTQLSVALSAPAAPPTAAEPEPEQLESIPSLEDEIEPDSEAPFAPPPPPESPSDQEFEESTADDEIFDFASPYPPEEEQVEDIAADRQIADEDLDEDLLDEDEDRFAEEDEGPFHDQSPFETETAVENVEDLEEDVEQLEASPMVSSDWSGLFQATRDQEADLAEAEGEEESSIEIETEIEPEAEIREHDDSVPSLESLLRSDRAEEAVVPEETPAETSEEAIVEEQTIEEPTVQTTPPQEEPELDEETQRKHDEARRFARLLISEIKLYHEDTVNEGRRQSDLYERLQRDIERSREMYQRRAASEVLSTRDHFHSELVRILAEGNESVLGEGYPGPRLMS